MQYNVGTIIALDGQGQSRTFDIAQDGTSAYVALHALAIDGAIVSKLGGVSLPVELLGVTLTQTIVVLASETSTPIIAANPLRRALLIQNIDTGDATLSLSATPVDGDGYLLIQGRDLRFGAGDGAPLGAMYAISPTGTRLLIWQGT